MLTTHNPTKIAALNDAARKSFSGCRVYMTPGVQALYQTQAIAARVQAYDDFTERNDPYGERDFGSFEFCGETIFAVKGVPFFRGEEAFFCGKSSAIFAVIGVQLLRWRVSVHR